MGLLPIKPAEVLLSYTGSANWSAGLSPPLESVPSGHRRVENAIFISFRGPKAHGDRLQKAGVRASPRLRNG